VGIVNPTGAKASHQNVLITAGIPAFTSVRVCGRELLLLLFLAVSRFVHPGTSGRNRARILARSFGRCGWAVFHSCELDGLTVVWDHAWPTQYLFDFMA
jgi:hypothetical protein